MTDELGRAFDSHALSHPLQGTANSVELFQATAILSGATIGDQSTGTEKLRTQIGHHDHYLFVLVDGLGMNLQDRFPPGGFFESAFHSEIRSVFPSTTAVALTSLATGAWPAKHGITGWWTFFPEHQRVIAPLIFTERGTGVPAGDLGLSVADLIPVEPFLGSFFRNPASYLPRLITDGNFAAWSRAGTTVHPFRNHGHLRRMIRRESARLRGPSYRYLYLLTVDKLCHQFGVRSHQVAAEVRRVDRLLSRIRTMLPGNVRMIVTADHGLVDVPAEKTFTIRSGDRISDHLVGGQSGEGRAPVFHIKPGHREKFLSEWENLGASSVFTLHSPEELSGMGIYGPVDLSEAAVLHLGDFVGISTTPARFEFVPDSSEPVKHVGVHGGLLPSEVDIPLFLA